jgi:hypothetical protein
LIWTCRLWLARLLSGASDFDSGVIGLGYDGSVGALAGTIRTAVRPTMPLAVQWSVGARWVRDLAPGTVRIVIEAPR